jgi:hypothetical protein
MAAAPRVVSRENQDDSRPATQPPFSIGLVLVQILLRHVVFGNLPRPDFAVRSVFDGVDDVGLESLTLLDELLDTLGIRELRPRQTLRVSGLTGGLRTEASRVPRRCESSGGGGFTFAADRAPRRVTALGSARSFGQG